MRRLRSGGTARRSSTFSPFLLASLLSSTLRRLRLLPAPESLLAMFDGLPGDAVSLFLARASSGDTDLLLFLLSFAVSFFRLNLHLLPAAYPHTMLDYTLSALTPLTLTLSVLAVVLISLLVDQLRNPRAVGSKPRHDLYSPPGAYPFIGHQLRVAVMGDRQPERVSPTLPPSLSTADFLFSPSDSLGRDAERAEEGGYH